MDWGASTAGLADMLGRYGAPARIYIANPGLNRLDVFDMRQRVFPEPYPGEASCPAPWHSANDGNTLPT